MANFKKAYNDKHKAAIQKDLSLNNVMEIPKMEKITVNTVSYTHLTLPTKA